jgi:hypothetical protein
MHTGRGATVRCMSWNWNWNWSRQEGRQGSTCGWGWTGLDGPIFGPSTLLSGTWCLGGLCCDVHRTPPSQQKSCSHSLADRLSLNTYLHTHFTSFDRPIISCIICLSFSRQLHNLHSHTMSVSTNDVVDDARGMLRPSSPYTKHAAH